MKSSTHLVGGVTASIIVHQTGFLPVTPTWYFYSAAVVGSLLPDLCHPQSVISRRLPILSFGVTRLFGHRSFTHSLLFLLIVYWLCGLWSITTGTIQAGLAIGIISHLLLDALTPRGIRLFYPLKSFIRFPFTTRTGSLVGETIVVSLLIGATCYMLFST